jgi:hypothetical protein
MYTSTRTHIYTVYLAVDGIYILLQNLTIEELLHLGHRDVHVDLGLGGEPLLDICLEATQQKRPQQLVQLACHLYINIY